MQLRMWQRLDVVETALQIQDRQTVAIRMDETETDAEFDTRIERWKAGESVDGIDSEYEGGELEIIRVRLISAKRQSQSDD